MKPRRAVVEDCVAISELHIKKFPKNYFTQFGLSAVYAYYRFAICTKYADVVVCKTEEKLCSFIVVARPKKSFYIRLYKDFKFIFAIFKGFIMSPRLLLSAIRKTKRLNHDLSDTGDLEITSLASCRNGAGFMVLNFVLEEAQYSKCSFSLRTPLSNNEKVLKFYKRFGFIIKGTYFNSNQEFCYMIRR